MNAWEVPAWCRPTECVNTWTYLCISNKFTVVRKKQNKQKKRTPALVFLVFLQVWSWYVATYAHTLVFVAAYFAQKIQINKRYSLTNITGIPYSWPLPCYRPHTEKRHGSCCVPVLHTWCSSMHQQMWSLPLHNLLTTSSAQSRNESKRQDVFFVTKDRRGPWEFRGGEDRGRRW